MHTQQLRACKYDYVCIPTPKLLTKTIDTTRLAQCPSTGLALQFTIADCKMKCSSYLLDMEEPRYLHGVLEPFASANSSVWSKHIYISMKI